MENKQEINSVEELRDAVDQFEIDMKRNRNFCLKLAVISGILLIVFGATKGFAKNIYEYSEKQQAVQDRHKEETDEILDSFQFPSDMMFGQGKIYVNFGIAEYVVEHQDNYHMDAKNWTGRIGYQIDDIWSVEFDMSKDKDSFVVNNNHVPYYNWNDMGVFVRASMLPEEKFRPFVKVGVVQTKQHYNSDLVDLAPFHPDGSDEWNIDAYQLNVKDRNLALGFGAEYDLTDNFGLRWDTQWVKFDRFNHYEERIGGTRKHIKSGLSAVYRF